MRKDAYLPQRSLKHAAPFITCVIYTVLKNICQVSGCIATSVLLQYILLCLSVSSVCYIHDIHHSYIFASFMHSCIFQCFEIIRSEYIYPQKEKKKKKQIWACHLSK